jgi:benzoylsuccinyl-CoA thiolase BbsA subunit
MEFYQNVTDTPITLPQPRMLSAEHFIFSPSDKPRLIGSQCNCCKDFSFPKSAICPTCLSEDIEEIGLSRRGNLYSYSVIHVGREKQNLPYALGYIDLPEGVRIFAHLTETTGLQVDIPVEISIHKSGINENSEPIYQFSFTPIVEEPAHA